MERLTLAAHRGRLVLSRDVMATKKKSSQAAPKLAGLKIKRILVPLDFSDAARQALSYAIALAQDMKAKITLLHVVEPIYVNSEPGMNYLPEQAEAEQTWSRKRIGQIAAKHVPKGMFDKAVVRSGTPYFEICEAAKKLKAGLIVVTTHGRTGLSHALMGSTAERVVRHASCPVLTVRRAGS